jgi:competence protein ComEC
MTLALVALAGSLVAAARCQLRTGTCLALAAFFMLGNVSNAQHRRAVDQSELRRVFARLEPREVDSPRRVMGRLRLEPDSRADATLLLVDVDTVSVGRRPVPARGGLRVTVRGEKRDAFDTWVAGDRVSLWTVMREPELFANPGSFNGTRYLERQHIDLVGGVKSGLLVRRSTSFPGIPGLTELPASFSHLRRRVLVRLEARLRSPDAFAVVAALVTGVRAELSPELIRLYQRAGIFHVMAISGAHVAIWCFVLHGVLRWVGFSTRTTMILLLVLLPLYAMFCGARPPVVRAVVMASVLMAARLASLRAPLANALALAALGLLLWEPANLWDAGFQLTMAAMAGIVVFHESLAERLAGTGYFAKPLAVSFAAQLGVMPVAAWHFHRLSLAAPLASLAAIPVAGAICILGLGLVVVSEVPVLGGLVAAAASGAVFTLTWIAQLASQLPAASIRVGAPSWPFLLAYAGASVALRCASSRLRWAGVALMGALLAVALVPYRPVTNTLEVTALDVGHGDAIVLSLPEGGTVLIDGGGLPMSSIDVGESVVLPFLLDRGVRRIDAVVATHVDYDHIGGLATILNEIRVDELWQGNADRERSAYRALRSAARDRNVPVRTLRVGQRFELEGASFEVLAAGDGLDETENDRSVVLRVGFAGRFILLTGDAEARLEARLVQSRFDLDADVLKLAHHGSRTSTTDAFLDAVQPEIAIVSARQSRHRPLPSTIVLNRLRERGIAYARTDESGAVTVRIESDGRMTLSTYR